MAARSVTFAGSASKPARVPPISRSSAGMALRPRRHFRSTSILEICMDPHEDRNSDLVTGLIGLAVAVVGLLAVVVVSHLAAL
jgi:hypothetical protein